MKNFASDISEISDSYVSDANARTHTLSYFILTVLGFSFWFFMAVPFASHREAYWWLATVHSQDLPGHSRSVWLPRTVHCTRQQRGWGF